MDAVARKLKLYGERNTGTNWLEHLAGLNLEVELFPSVAPAWLRKIQNTVPGTEWLRDLWFRGTVGRTFGWKHALVDPARPGFERRAVHDKVGFVCLVKHPAAWLLSLHRRPYDHFWGPPGDLATFAASPWYTVGREQAPRSYPNPISLWNAKAAGYLALAARLPAMVMRYEDLVVDPAARIDDIAARFGLRRRSAEFRNDEESTKRDATKFEEYRRYYGEERWRAKLPREVATVIAKQIDPQLLAKLGYQPYVP